MKRFILATAVASLIAVCIPARATVIIAPNTVSFEGLSGGVLQPSYDLSITYDVNEINPGVYEYDYDLSTTAAEKLTSFTIGGAPDPIDTDTMIISNYGHASVSGSGFDSDSVGWVWAFNSGVTSDDLSFTSDIAPGYATFTANDDDIEWSSGAMIPAPVPEPEPSSFALFAGVAALAGGLLKRRSAAK